jgi:hypothetical protein
MDLRRGDRAPEATSGALPWSAPRSNEPHPHHAGSLHGATATGEAARPRLAVRIGLWLDEGGKVHKARWRASDDAGLRAAAEAACASLEAGGGRPPDAAVLGEAGGPSDRAEMVTAAIEAAARAAGSSPAP